MYRLGMPPYINVVCMVVLTVVVLVFQIYIMKELTSFNIKTYVSKTIKPALFSTALAVMPLLIVNHFINYSSILNIIAIFVGVVWTVFSIYVCGITNEEKNLITSFIKRKLEKYKPHNNK
jgi:CDP-diglyceride synthetase